MDPDKILLISPNAGFGNRLRTICAGILLARLLGRKYYHCWSRNDNIKSDEAQNVKDLKMQELNDYFIVKDCSLANETLIPDICYTEWMPGEYWYSKQSYGQEKWKPKQLRKYKSTDDIIHDNSNIIMIESSYIIKPGSISEDSWRNGLSKIYSKHFVPHERFLNSIPKEEHDVGISVRRGELLWYFPEAKQSSEDLIKWISTSFEGKRVWIFSEDHEFRDIIRNSTNKTDNPIDMPNSWEKGFIEFLTLAYRCSIIYGTPSSSFAEEAAIFGNKPYYKTLSI